MRLPDLNDEPGSWLAAPYERSGFARYAYVLRLRLWLIAAFVVVAVGGAVAYLAVAPKTYRAEADILVTPVSPDDPNLVGLSLVRDTSDPSSDVLTVSKLVDSPAVAQLVAQQIGGNPTALLGSVQATPVTQSEIIAVDATAGSASRAAAIANSFANQTIAQRTSSLHAQLATLIPSLEQTMNQLAPSDRASMAAQLAVLEALRLSPDPTVRVSSTATPPGSPASPKPTLSLVAGALGGLILGVLAVFAIQAIDPRLRDEEQLREIYRLPLLSRIPRQRSAHTPLIPGALEPPALEAFRNLRAIYTILERSRDAADTGRSILITGDNASNGKTTVALNLAAELADAGKQTILIEGDVRRPSIGAALRVRASRGLADVLRGETPLADALIWAREYGPQLELLLADRSEGVSFDRMPPGSIERLVREAALIADFVIIDSPPLADVRDALAFADVADDVVLVARAGQSRVRRLGDLGELLANRGITPSGVILVGSDRSDTYYYAQRQSREAVATTPRLGLLQRRPESPVEIPRVGTFAP